MLAQGLRICLRGIATFIKQKKKIFSIVVKISITIIFLTHLFTREKSID